MAVQVGLRQRLQVLAAYHPGLMVDVEQLLEERLAILRGLMAHAVQLMGMIYLFFTLAGREFLQDRTLTYVILATAEIQTHSKLIFQL